MPREKPDMTVLVLNAGSTSIKLALYDRRLQQLWSASVSGLASGPARLRASDADHGAAGEKDLGPLSFGPALDLLLGLSRSGGLRSKSTR